MMNRESGKSSHNIIRGIQKADIVLIVGCLLAAALLGIFFIVHRETGNTVRILFDGTEIKAFFLHSSKMNPIETADGYYLITYSDDMADVEYSANKSDFKLAEGTSYNLLYVAEGTVFMEEADCRDQICVHHRPVSSVRESIVCLPHRLVVEITGDHDAPVDQRDGNSEKMPYETLDGVVR